MAARFHTAAVGMTALTAGGGLGYRLQVGAPSALAVSVVMAPQQSVLALLRQAASGHSTGAPIGLLTTIGKALRPQARFAAHSFTARGPLFIPEFCTPIPPLADASVAQQADRLRDMASGALTDELQAADCDQRTHWRSAGHQPRRWLNSMADASLDTWAAIRPRWRAAGPLIDREVRRVGIAVVRGGMVALLNSLHPQISYTHGMLVCAVPHDRHVTLGRRRLALLPMIAGRGALIVSFERPDVCYVGYPVRPPTPGTQPPSGGALAMILGSVRSAILQALRQPLTVGELAAAVQCAPTTATYHLHQLAAAGMITREQRGTSVRVSRTTRGDELVDLLSD